MVVVAVVIVILVALADLLQTQFLLNCILCGYLPFSLCVCVNVYEHESVVKIGALCVFRLRSSPRRSILCFLRFLCFDSFFCLKDGRISFSSSHIHTILSCRRYILHILWRILDSFSIFVVVFRVVRFSSSAVYTLIVFSLLLPFFFFYSLYFFVLFSPSLSLAKTEMFMF